MLKQVHITMSNIRMFWTILSEHTKRTDTPVRWSRPKNSQGESAAGRTCVCCWTASGR